MSTDTSATGVSAWSPFRHRLFAAMWGAQFVSNTGSWMQTVAAHERVSKRDQDRLDRVRDLTDPGQPTTVTHWLAAGR
jgi:hypothetical protein